MVGLTDNDSKLYAVLIHDVLAQYFSGRYDKDFLNLITDKSYFPLATPRNPCYYKRKKHRLGEKRCMWLSACDAFVFGREDKSSR